MENWKSQFENTLEYIRAFLDEKQSDSFNAILHRNMAIMFIITRVIASSLRSLILFSSFKNPVIRNGMVISNS